MPLDILIGTARDKALPIELRLAAARAVAPYYHVRVSTGPPKASFEMTGFELKTAIAREKEHLLRADPGPHQIRSERCKPQVNNGGSGWHCPRRSLPVAPSRLVPELIEAAKADDWDRINQLCVTAVGGGRCDRSDTQP
jgi:hypothetical protein